MNARNSGSFSSTADIETDQQMDGRLRLPSHIEMPMGYWKH